MDYQKIINEIATEIDRTKYDGKVADYIPELSKVSPDKFGIHLSCIDGGSYSYGDSEEKFSIQSIAKVFLLSMASLKIGDKVLERVGVEPSGNPFNSLTQLEYESGIPRNPFINAGALVVSDILLTEFENPKEELLKFVRKIAQNPTINYNLKVAKSEKTTGFRNIALVNYMKSLGNIRNKVEDVLDFYFYTSALTMTCRELSETFRLFANGGCLVGSGERVLKSVQTKRINAIMETCGFYDEAGEFAFRVGLPGKSGVGGGIVAVYPGSYSVVVWSPKLNPKGNSALGMRVLELLTTKTKSSLF